MSKIKTVYITNHSHTDIGFTDYQDLCFEQHSKFVDQALDLCEQTEAYPDEARYRWTCEVTGTTEKYFETAPNSQIDRFLHWQEKGGISVAGMQYNLTPLLNEEQMIRSLLPVRRFRENYGVEISAAMQSDVNGVSWKFADLLLDLDIRFLTMSVNPSRGGVPKPMPNGFWWESPQGNKLLAWNGYHYLFGRNIAKLADWRFVENDFGKELERLENDDQYQFDFMYCQATHPIRVDNGPPDIRLADFVRDWNASGREPQMVLTNPASFGKLLEDRYGDTLETRRGDWTDWWSDGVASSAYETGLNRTTHQILELAEVFTAANASSRNSPTIKRIADAYENATLYDEHTWGGFASIERPHEAWVKAQWNKKAGFAYQAFADAHDIVAGEAQQLVSRLGESSPEGMFNLGDMDPDDAYPHSDNASVLVFNPLPWSREISIDEPELRGHAAPAGMLDHFFPRGVGWGGLRPDLPVKRLRGEVPGFGYTILTDNDLITDSGLSTSDNIIENEYYRVQIDPNTGGIEEWFDKQLNKNLAGVQDGWKPGQYIYEWVDSPKQRDALFYNDFSAEDFGERFTDTPFVRESVTRVEISQPRIQNGVASIEVKVTAPGIESGVCTYSLSTGEKVLALDWLIDKKATTDVEAVFIAFPFHLDNPRFRADINSMAITPEADQLSGAVRDWYPVGGWIDVSSSDAGVTVVPLDAPLVHIGGITTGKWATELQPEAASVFSWALNNHWMVNFKASQPGVIPLRYRLTSHADVCDDSSSERFAREQAMPGVAVRDVVPSGGVRGEFFSVQDNPAIITHVKPADFGEGTIFRFRNMSNKATDASIRIANQSKGEAFLTTPDERDLDPLPMNDGIVTVSVGPLASQSIRIV